jgi:hypothetical protein
MTRYCLFVLLLAWGGHRSGLDLSVNLLTLWGATPERVVEFAQVNHLQLDSVYAYRQAQIFYLHKDSTPEIRVSRLKVTVADSSVFSCDWNSYSVTPTAYDSLVASIRDSIGLLGDWWHKMDYYRVIAWKDRGKWVVAKFEADSSSKTGTVSLLVNTPILDAAPNTFHALAIWYAEYMKSRGGSPEAIDHFVDSVATTQKWDR